MIERRTLAFGLASAALLLAGAVVAQQTVDGPYVLHEQLSDEQMTAATGAASDRPFAPFADGEEGPGGAPARVPGQPPPLTTEAGDEEPVYDADGPVARDEVEAPHGPLNPFASPNVLDDNTDRVSSLTYFANFDPSVIPLKRVVSQNQVVQTPEGDYAVRVNPGTPELVSVGGTENPDDETFWGSFLLRTESKRWHPIASVAPDQRILEVRTEPEVDLEIRRDLAGNFLVRTRHSGMLRLNMKVAVDPFFFNGEFDQSVRWEDFDTIDDAPQLDREVRRNALGVLRDLGITRGVTPAKAVRDLVEHYRDFAARPFPDELRSGDLFTSITKNKIGVCRHRSLSFVVAAHALGIPAHYVNNEAHAFVEIAWPGRGWRRIDLGGAADELNAAADSGRSLHSPGEDSLPRPERYLEEQDRMAQNGLGGGDSDDGTGGADGTEGESGESGESGETESADGSGPAGESAELDPGQASESGEPMPGADGEPGNPGQPGTEQTEVAGSPADGSLTPGADTEPGEEMRMQMEAELMQSIEDEGGDERIRLAPTSLQLVRAVEKVRRGSRIEVVGRLGSESAPLPNAGVFAYLGPPGTRDVAGAVKVGEGRTDSSGRVVVTVDVPREQSTGRWSLFLVYPGSRQHAPAVAE